MTNIDPKERAAELIAQGYMQTSTRYRMLSRLPEGLDGYEALRQACPDAAQLRKDIFVDACRAHYLRVHAPPEHKIEITESEFLWFKRLHGPVA